MKEGFHLKHYADFINPGVHKSLMLTSIDDSHGKVYPRYMSQIKTKVIDFDEVKKNYLALQG